MNTRLDRTRRHWFLLALLLAGLASAPLPGVGAESTGKAIEWIDNLDGALTRAASEYRSLLVVFSSPTCPWCLRMKADVLSDPDVQAAIEGLICVEIDTSRDSKTAQQFQISGIPAVALVSGDGRTQALAEGFMDKKRFLEFIADYRKGGRKVDGKPEMTAWLKALAARSVDKTQWQGIMAGMGIKESRARLHEALMAYDPVPRREWVDLLGTPRLSVRLGTLEVLEEVAGDTFGFDPWGDAASNSQALERWNEWAAKPAETNRSVYASLTESQIGGYVRDLASGDRDRAARAVRMLEQAGSGVIPVLEASLTSSNAPGEEAVRRIREVRYFLELPANLGVERARIVHRLVFGNLDERLKSLAGVAVAGRAALPILADFLADPDPMIRETAVDNVILAGKDAATPLLVDLLKGEKDEDVIHAVLRGVSKLKQSRAIQLAGPFVKSANEDLAIAALNALGQVKNASFETTVCGALKDSRWRVRVAALEALAKMRSSSVSEQVIACLDDADPFVRQTAVQTLIACSSKKAGKQLETAFRKDDQLKGAIMAAYRQLDLPAPTALMDVVKDKDPEVFLAVIEGMGDGGNGYYKLALPFMGQANNDVACAAIKVVASAGGSEGGVRSRLAKILHEGGKERVLAVLENYQPEDPNRNRYSPMQESLDIIADLGTSTSTLEDGGETNALGDLFAGFATEPAPTSAPPKVVTGVPTNTAAAPVGIQDLFSAFGAGENAAMPAGQPAGGAPGIEARGSAADELSRAVMVYLAPSQESTVRFTAALMLLRMGKGTGITFIAESLDAYPADERLKVAKHVLRCGNESALPLLKRLLRDPATDVRRSAVEAILENDSAKITLAELLTAVFEPKSVLRPADVMKEQNYQWNQILAKPVLRRESGAKFRAVLERPDNPAFDDAQRILALYLLGYSWRDGDHAVVEKYREAANPFVRRAAWYTMGTKEPEFFQKSLRKVVGDSSEWVRLVIPSVYSTGSGYGAFTVYFDAQTMVDGIYTYDYNESRKRLKPTVVAALRVLTDDPVLPVKVAAGLSLLGNRETINVAALISTLELLPDQSLVIGRIQSMLSDSSSGILSRLNPQDTLALLDYLTARQGEEDERLALLRKKVMGDSVSGAVPLAVVMRRDGLVSRGGTGGATGVVSQADARGVRTVVFFQNPGCQDCERVSKWLETLRRQVPGLVVEEMNIRNPDAARVNEVLSDRFGVPGKYRMVAPAVFCGAGVLVKDELKFDRLAQLVRQGEAAETAWRDVDAVTLAQADQTLAERYKGFSLWVVLLAGLLDGVNPCAFATIIFLLSYLHVARRGPREILSVGMAFVAGVFLTYFLLGLGLVEVVVKFSLLRRLGQLLNVGMALFVLGIAVFSIWDGIQCLRGKMSSMVLQLPVALKDRIHGAVRTSARHRNFVVAAFLAGVVVSVLELACTGQVYAPTILYILKTGIDKGGAIAYLAFYNLAFVFPLVVVFGLAYGGLKSEVLTHWLQRRAAWVKFGTAILFLALFALLISEAFPSIF